MTLYALTAMWDKIWATGVVISSEALFDVSDRAARAALDRKLALVLRGLGLLPAAYATCRCAMGDGPRPLRA